MLRGVVLELDGPNEQSCDALPDDFFSSVAVGELLGPPFSIRSSEGVEFGRPSTSASSGAGRKATNAHVNAMAEAARDIK